MEILKATSIEDIKKLAQLAEIIWNEHFTSIIGQEQVNYMLNKFQSYEAISNMIFNEGYIYYMLYDNGELSGYCGILVNESDKSIFISKLYIEKNHRGRKLSKLLLEELKKNFCNYKKIWLTVNKHNDNTIAIYKKMGFVIIKEQVSDIGNGFVMDDYVMELKI